MKKWFALLLAICLSAAAIAACKTGGAENEPSDTDMTQEAQTQETVTQEAEAPAETETEAEPEEPAAAVEPGETVSEPQEAELTPPEKALVYYINDDATAIVTEEIPSDISVGELNMILTEKGVLADDMMILSVEPVTEAGEPAVIADMAGGFGDFITGMGSFGEDMIHDCLINTLSSLYGATYVKFTEGGGGTVSTEHGDWGFEKAVPVQ